MATELQSMEDGFREIAPKYIRGNFEPTDRLAVVLINKRADSVIQRLATAEKLASPDFQAWLRHQNAQGCDVYISMNTLKEDARGRTKADIAEIRHVFLDLDENGSEALRTILERKDLPTPSFIVNTSADKWQVIWKVESFDKHQAEQLQRALARDTGADPAATDCARVMRLPGLHNHKYDQPFPVRMEPHSALSGEVFRPEHFPQYQNRENYQSQAGTGRLSANRPSGQLSQSERDWAFARRALARGEPEDMVVAAIASHRRYDKHNPQYYAELTVRKAKEALESDHSRADSLPAAPER